MKTLNENQFFNVVQKHVKTSYYNVYEISERIIYFSS
jgi:hypothetical protein